MLEASKFTIGKSIANFRLNVLHLITIFSIMEIHLTHEDSQAM